MNDAQLTLRNRLADAFVAHEHAALAGDTTSVVRHSEPCDLCWFDFERAGGVAASILEPAGSVNGRTVFAVRETSAPLPSRTVPASGDGAAAPPSSDADQQARAHTASRVLGLARYLMPDDGRRHRFLVSAIRQLGKHADVRSLFVVLRELSIEDLEAVLRKLEDYGAATRRLGPVPV